MLRTILALATAALIGCDLIDSIKDEVDPPPETIRRNHILMDSTAVIDTLENGQK